MAFRPRGSEGRVVRARDRVVEADLVVQLVPGARVDAPRVRRDALQPRRVGGAGEGVARQERPLRERRVLEAAAQDRQQRACVVARRGLLEPRDRAGAVIAADVAGRRLDDGVAEAQRRGRPQRLGGLGQTSEPREAPAPAQRRRAQARVVAERSGKGVQRGGVVVELDAALAEARPLQGSDCLVALRADVAFQDRRRSLPVLVLDELRRREAGSGRAGQQQGHYHLDDACCARGL